MKKITLICLFWICLLASYSIEPAKVLLENQVRISHHQTVDVSSINMAVVQLQNRLKTQPESRADNYTLLGLALILKDNALTRKTWKDYFYIPGQFILNDILENPDSALKEILEKDTIKSTDRDNLIKALADSKMYELALMTTELYPVEHECTEIIKIKAYTKYIKQFEKTVYSYFQDKKSGHPDKKKLISSIEKLNHELWTVLCDSTTSEYSLKRFRKVVSGHFGTIFAFNTKYDIYYIGHRIYDKKVLGIQDERKLEFTYSIIDFEYGNAYLGWLRNIFLFGAYSLKGPRIYKFRAHTNELAIKCWNQVVDTIQIQKLKKTMENDCKIYESTGMQEPY